MVIQYYIYMYVGMYMYINVVYGSFKKEYLIRRMKAFFFKSGSGTYMWSLELPRLSQGGTAAADGYS